MTRRPVSIALAALMLSPVQTAFADPIPGPFQSKAEARSLDCERLSHAEAHQRFPGEVPDLPARRLVGTADALACRQRIMREGERAARDEAILSTLSSTVAELTQAAQALEPGSPQWHVDAFYPQTAVASKIAVAARTALVERGQRVSDRVPVLAAGDIAVLSRLSPKEVYPLACKRFFAEGALEDGDAFLAVMINDPRETQLHAGVCRFGEWKWLR